MSSSSDANIRRNLRPGDTLVVRHNFDARSPDELSLRRGDHIQLLQLDEGFWDGWWTGKHLDSDRSGLFPGVYTTPANSSAIATPTAGPPQLRAPEEPATAPITAATVAAPTTTVTTSAATTAAAPAPATATAATTTAPIEIATAPAADQDITSESEASYVDPSLRELYRPLSTFALDINFANSNTIKDNQQEEPASPPFNPADVPAQLSTPQRENSKSLRPAPSVRSFNAFRSAGLTTNTTAAAAAANNPSRDSRDSMNPDEDRDSPVFNETLSFINAHITKLNAKDSSTTTGAALASITATTAGSGYAPTATTMGDTVGGTRALSTIRQRGKEEYASESPYHGDYDDGDYTTMMPEPETESESEDDRYQEGHSTLLPPTITMQSQQQPHQQQQLQHQVTQKPSQDQLSLQRRIYNDSASEYSANLSFTNYNNQTRPSSQQYGFQQQQQQQPQPQSQPYPQQQQQQQLHHHQHSLSTPSTSASNESTTSAPYLTADQVRQWSPAEVSHHLLTIGVDPQHCIVFEEQEITGDVLLEMEQSTMFMKEFNFGTMGRRLKTWYRIKAFQEEVLYGPDGPDNSGVAATAAAVSSMHGSRAASRAASRSTSRMGGGNSSMSNNSNINNNSAVMGPSGGIGAAIADMRNSVASSMRHSLLASDAQRDDSTFLPRIPSQSGGERPSSPFRSYSQASGAAGGSGSRGLNQGPGGHGFAPTQNPAAFGYGHGHSYSTSTGSASIHNQPYLHHQQQIQNPASAYNNGPRYPGIGETADQFNNHNNNFGSHHPSSTTVPTGAAHPLGTGSAASASFTTPSRPGTNMSSYSAHARVPPQSSDSADTAAPPPVIGGAPSARIGMMGFNEFQHPLAKQISQGQIQRHMQDSMSLANGPSSVSQVDVDRGYFSEMEPQTPRNGGENGVGAGMGIGGGKVRGRSGNGFKKSMWAAGHFRSKSRGESVGGGAPPGTAVTQSDGVSSHRRFSNLSGLGSTGANGGGGGPESAMSPTNVNGFVGLYGDQITEEPAVTNLEEEREQQLQQQNAGRMSVDKKRLSQSPTLRKAFGRTASETDKGRHGQNTPVGSPTARSFDSHERPTSVAENRASVDGTSLAHAQPKTPTKSSTTRSKSKKDTSAYTKGLEKKTPQEQLASGCDFYGWMKKRSSNLMTTWRPRFFILHGRRLSYYYSENDTEERGVIDISGHRVIADNDLLVSLHASLTGSKAVPSTSAHPIKDGEEVGLNIREKEKEKMTASGGSEKKSSKSKKHGSAPEAGATPKGGAANTEAKHSPHASSSSSTQNKDKNHHHDHKADKGPKPFIFKLVPPKPGAARSVQFTKPSVHYFQVDNISQGRLWMAAMLKATIERDANLPVRTTNKQKTISLRQAAASHQRPPALMGLDERGLMGAPSGNGGLPLLGIGNGMGLGVFDQGKDDGGLTEEEEGDFLGGGGGVHENKADGERARGEHDQGRTESGRIAEASASVA